MASTTTDTLNEGTTLTPDKGARTQPERLFTQAEVDKIVTDRLNRERKKTAAESSETSITERETELSNRENALACREYITSNNLPAALLEVLNTTSVDAFKACAEKIRPYFSAKTPTTRTFSSSPSLSGGVSKSNDGLRKVFGLK